MKEYTPLHVNFDKKLDRLLYRILQGEEVSSYEIISGRILRVEFEGDRYIKIEDKIEGGLYMLSSYINPIEGSSNEYSAGFSLYTRNNLLSGAEFVHPDMYASRFVKIMLNHYKNRGYAVSQLVGDWELEGEANFDEFVSNMNAGLAVADSAEKTWSGRLYKELGYGIISDNDVIIDRDSNQTIERAYSIFRKI